MALADYLQPNGVYICLCTRVPTEDAEETEKVKRAGECCRQILNYVNQAVKESENKQVSV